MENVTHSASTSATTPTYITSEIASKENVTYSVTGAGLNTTTNSIPIYTLSVETWPENSTEASYSISPMDLVTSAVSDYFEGLGNSSTNSDESLVESGAARRKEVVQFWIGVALSVSSSLFIGLSFIIKKKALIRLSKGGRRANQGGYGYLKDFLWWSGLLSMAVGEAANFMAYTFAPASLVSTLGVLSVLVTAILSSKYLRERLNFLGKVGCFLCAIGSTVIVIHAPIEKDIESMDDLQEKLTNVMFVIYVLFSIVLSIILIYHYRPKLPETSTYTLLIWIGVCSLIGSLSVMSVKGLGLALMQTVTGMENQLGNWLTWFCFITLLICVSVQMNFLNKALDTFNTAVVTPVYYVFFTSCVITASAILFNEFAYLPVNDWVGLICGFLTVLTAIILLHLCKNFDLTLASLAQQIDLVNEDICEDDGIPKHEVLEVETSGSETDKGFSSSSNKRLRENDPGDDEEESTTTDQELYKSIESCGSHCFRGSGKGEKTKKLLSLSGSGSLTPDVRLLSGSFSYDLRGRRSKDGYIPVSYGTTDEVTGGSSNKHI